MSFRLVSGAGIVVDPSFVNVYASGTIQRGSVVDLNRSNSGLGTAFNTVSPSSSSSTVTTVFGVSLDYVQGNSDTLVRIVPFVQGQIWEADCVSAINTLSVGKKQQLYNASLINNTSYDQTGVTGVFLVYNVDGLTTGSGKVLGRFVNTDVLLQNGSVTF